MLDTFRFSSVQRGERLAVAISDRSSPWYVQHAPCPRLTVALLASAMFSVLNLSTQSLSSVSDKVRTSFKPNHSCRTMARDVPLDSHYTETSVDGRNNFNMDSTRSQTSEEKSQPLLCGST